MDDDRKPVWMDPRGDNRDVSSVSVGDVGFLFRLERQDEYGKPKEGAPPEHRLLDHPAVLMNGKNTKVLFGGPCHTYEQGSYKGTALGMARVTKFARNGRMQVTPIDPDEYPEEMEKLGYPDLPAENKF